MNPPPSLVLLGLVVFVVWMSRVPGHVIKRFHLRPMAVCVLVAAAATPTWDLLTDLICSGVLFVVYLVGVSVVRRVRGQSDSATVRPGRAIKRFHLPALVTCWLAAVAVSPAPDLLTEWMLTGALFAVYLVGVFVVNRIRVGNAGSVA